MALTEFNIIGDVAGCYKTLRALLAKMPDVLPISLGDMIDRGPDALSVVNFFKTNGLAILGNHEHMFVDYYCQNHQYDGGVWFYNGGLATYEQLGDNNAEITSMLEYFLSLPITIEMHDVILTHAPIHGGQPLEKSLKWSATNATNNMSLMNSVIWNRGTPKKRKLFQVFGHQSFRNPTFYGPEKNPFAVCIDCSSHGTLWGMHWPSRQLFSQEKID